MVGEPDSGAPTMAASRLPEEFFDLVAHHLPPEQPVGRKGGRPRVGHRVVVRVILFVLATGTRWEDIPTELGCSGRTAHRRLRPGRNWASGTGCMPTCSACSAFSATRTSSTRTR